MPRHLTTAAAVAIALAGGTGIAGAQDGPFEMQIAARQGIMAYRALQLGTLGAMAKGEVDYDAAAAQKAADNLMASVTLDGSMLWPQGSDNEANPKSEALPGIWEDFADFTAKASALEARADTLASGLETPDDLNAGLGQLGEACTACHKAYRE